MAMERDKDLQRYFDGELSPRRMRKVHARLQRDPDAQRRLQAMERLRAALGDAVEASADDASFDHLWTRVKAGVGAQPPIGLAERLALWLRRYRVALAGAAAVVLLAAIVVAASRGAEPAPQNDAVIESIETGPGAMSTIFTIEDPGQAGETTVIWVTETSAEGDMQ